MNYFVTTYLLIIGFQLSVQTDFSKLYIEFKPTTLSSYSAKHKAYTYSNPKRTPIHAFIEKAGGLRDTIPVAYLTNLPVRSAEWTANFPLNSGISQEEASANGKLIALGMGHLGRLYNKIYIVDKSSISGKAILIEVKYRLGNKTRFTVDP